MRHALNRVDICCEEIDGEVIVINLTTGCYYSLVGTAADLWPMAVAGWTAEEMAGHVASSALPSAETAAEIAKFLEYLRAENVIEASAEASRENLDGLAQAQNFTIPVIEKFTDMQELLLLDPIHEVAEAGWPRRDTDA